MRQDGKSNEMSGVPPVSCSAPKKTRSDTKPKPFLFPPPPPTPDERFDSAFLGMAQQHQNITSLLHTFFSFLERRTDFYHVQVEGDSKIGFKYGYSFNLLNNIYLYYFGKYVARRQAQLRELVSFPKLMQATDDYETAPTIATAAKPAESVADRSSSGSKIPSSSGAPPLKKDSRSDSSSSTGGTRKVSKEQTGDISEAKVDVPTLLSPKETTVECSSMAGDNDGAPKTTTKPQAQISPSSGGTKVKASDGRSSDGHISTWNGCETDKYLWSQSLYDVTVEVKLPLIPILNESSGVASYRTCCSEDMSVTIEADRVHVGILEGSERRVGNDAKVIRGDTDDPELREQIDYYGKLTGGNNVGPIAVLSGQWSGNVRKAESVWNIDSRTNQLIISMEKIVETWWTSLIKGDIEIDGTTVESTKQIDEYDGETQGFIRKLLYDQRQKMKGEPTSEEVMKNSILEKAWNAEGSPFAGMPFDPSTVNIQGDLSGFK